MKSLSTIINPSRFSKYFKKEMRENRKQLLSRALIMIAILCAFSLITGLGESSTYNRYEEFLINHPNSTVDDAKNSLLELYTHNPFTYYDEASANCLSIFVFGFPITLIICASCMFESMSTKQKKIATLMAPATQFEKYLTRFFTYIILPIFIYIAGCLIAESLRFITFSIFYPVGDIIRFMDYSDIIKDMLIKDNMLFHTIVLYLLSSIAQASIYALGSSIWPRLALLKTFAAQCIISFIGIVTLMIAAISGAVEKSAKTIGAIAQNLSLDIEFTTFMWLLHISLLIFISINFSIAYFRFKESEIIQRM